MDPLWPLEKADRVLLVWWQIGDREYDTYHFEMQEGA